MSFPRRLRKVAYQAFYSMPGSLRRFVARRIAPKFLVGAVAIVRDSETDDSRLLLLRQPGHRGWGLPAGLLKKREPPVVGASRELFEESGVRIDPADLSAGVPNAIVHASGIVDTIWLGSVPASTTPLRVDGGEVLEAAWFPIDDLPPLTVNTALLLGNYGIGPRAGEQQP